MIYKKFILDPRQPRFVLILDFNGHVVSIAPKPSQKLNRFQYREIYYPCRVLCQIGMDSVVNTKCAPHFFQLYDEMLTFLTKGNTTFMNVGVIYPFNGESHFLKPVTY